MVKAFSQENLDLAHIKALKDPCRAILKYKLIHKYDNI